MAKLLIVKTALTKRAHAEEALKNYDKVITTNFNSFPLYQAIKEAKKLGRGTVINFAGVTASLFDNFDVNVVNEKGRVVRYSSYNIIDNNDYYGYLTVVARCAKAGVKVLFGKKKPNLKEAEKLPVKFASYAQVQEVKNFLHRWCKDSSNLERVNYYTTKHGETLNTYDGGDGNFSYVYKKEIKFKTKYFFKEDKFITYSPNFTYAPTDCKGKYEHTYDYDCDIINFTITDVYTKHTQDTDVVAHVDNIVVTKHGNEFNMNTVILNDTKYLTGLVHQLGDYYVPVIDKAVSSYKHTNYLFTDADIVTRKDEKGEYQPAPVYNIADTPSIIKNILPLFNDIFEFNFNYEAINEAYFLDIVIYYLHNYFKEFNHIDYNKLVGISKLLNILGNELRGWVPGKYNNLMTVNYIVDVKLYEANNWNKDGSNVIDNGDDEEESSAELNIEYDNDNPVVINKTNHNCWDYNHSDEFNDYEFNVLNAFCNLTNTLDGIYDYNHYAIDANYFLNNREKFDALYRAYGRSGYKIMVTFTGGKKPE